MTQQLNRRTVKTITETLEPKEIFELITAKQGDYLPELKEEYTIRDHSAMALNFLTVARVTEIFGGDKQHRVYVAGLVPGDPRAKGNWKEIVVGKHPGLQVENIEITDNFVFIHNMGIVKRSQKLINKYGPQVALRDRLRFPLKRGLYDNAFYDQLVPFAWMFRDYVENHAPKSGKLYPYQDHWAWYLVRYYTGMFPNWFRAQADRFYGYYITKDSVKHSKFVGRVNPASSAPYIRYSDSSDLKDVTLSMDFNWITPTVKRYQK